MIRAAVLSIGDEIVTGHVVDTNAAYLASKLSEMGIEIVRQVSVPDVHAVIVEVLRELAGGKTRGNTGGITGGVDVIVVTGGLGPTRDDITRYALGEVMGDEMVIDEKVLATLQARYSAHGRAFAENNAVQAHRPEHARCIDNSFGTAPGLVAELRCGNSNDNMCAIAFFMPGVPREMKEMWVRSVKPAITERFGEGLDQGTAFVRYVHAVSLAESRIGELLSNVMARGKNPLVATLPGDSVVKVRIRAWDDEESSAREKAEAMEEDIASRLNPYVFARGSVERTLGEVVQELMIKKGKRLAVAESCTAGLLGAMLTEQEGASDFFVGGWEVYSNEMKVKCLGVDEAVIEKYGAFSSQCAAAMAQRAVAGSGVDYALSITGIAGPGRGTDEKQVGTVFVGLAEKNADATRVVVKRFRFSGARDQVRTRSALAGMAMLYFALSGVKEEDGLPRMLWEVGKESGLRKV